MLRDKNRALIWAIITRFDYLEWEIFELAFLDKGLAYGKGIPKGREARKHYKRTGKLKPEVARFCHNVLSGKRHYWDEQNLAKQKGAAKK